MSVESLVVQRYRGLRDLRLDELRPVNLIVGANNAGKSSVLEAASVALRPFDVAAWVGASRSRDESMSHVDGIWSFFPNARAFGSVEHPASTELLVIQLVRAGRHRMVYARARTLAVLPEPGDDDSPRRVGAAPFVRVRVGLDEDGQREDRTLRLNRLAREAPAVDAIPCVTLTPGGHRSTETFLAFLSGAVEAGEKDEALALVRLFDPQIEAIDLTFSNRRPGVRARHQARGVVDLASFGDGLRRAALFGLALRRAAGGVLMIDELEGGTHRGLLGKVLRALVLGARQAKVQIMATTHSLEALDALVDATNDQPDDLAVYHLRQNDDGKHEALRVDGARAGRVRALGVDLR